MRWPSIQVGDQPCQLLSGPMTAAPSVMRRATAMISAMVMSAVSSVSTPGVLVTVMPRASAVSTSILSTPVPKLAMSLSWSPACPMTALSMRSVTVGTSTSACLTASISSALAEGLVVGVEPGVEEFHHPGLDDVGQLAGDDDQGFALRHKISLREAGH